MKFLFCIQNTTHHRTLFDYIKELSRNHEVVTYFIRPELDRLVEETEKFSKVYKFYKDNEIPKHEMKKNNSLNKRNGFIQIKKILYFFYMFKKNLSIINECKNIIEKIKPDKVYISSDRYINFDLFLAKNCLKMKIPVIVCGINLFFVKNTGAYFNSNQNREIKTYFQKIMRFIFPRQTFTFNDRKCLFFETSVILNLFLMGCLPKVPWLNGSTFVSETHVDCEKTKEIYLKNGIPSKKIKVTGLFEYKFLKNALENKSTILNLFGFDQQDKIAIISLPQLYEHNIISKLESDNIIEKVIKVLCSQKKYKIIVSLHPKMELKDYLYLSEKYNLKISRLPLRDIMPIANIFISTYSSTVLWSIILGIPSLLFDLYNLNYHVYDENKGVILVEDINSFTNEFYKLIEDPYYYSQILEFQKNDSQFYGNINMHGLIE